MKIRENSAIKRGTAEFEVIKRQVLDLYVITENAAACYALYRRATTGEEYNENRANASTFFKKDENVAYMEQRRVELARKGFEQYSRMMSLDISELKQKEDKYSDVEELTPDELRTKNLLELEELKDEADPNLKAQIIKQQTELMDAKRKEKEEQSTEKYIHYYLPVEKCNDCPHKSSLIKKHQENE